MTVPTIRSRTAMSLQVALPHRCTLVASKPTRAQPNPCRPHNRTRSILVQATSQQYSPPALVAPEWTTLSTSTVLRVTDSTPTSLTDLWRPDQRAVVACMTHFGDLSSFEFAQKLLPLLPQLDDAGVAFVCCGLGEPEKAKAFCRMLSFPEDRLYAGARVVRWSARERGHRCKNTWR